MPSDKDRLYVALYARGGRAKMPGLEDTYHWALIVGPKREPENGKGMRYHAMERVFGPEQTGWLFEESEIPLSSANMLLVRIIIAKIGDRDRLVDILRKVPIRQRADGWNCVGWVKEALEELKKDNKVLGRSVVEWETVRGAAMDYCRRKKDGGRFNGKGDFDTTKPPTYDLIKEEETIP